MAGRPKGLAKTGGRKKGTPNRTSQEALIRAFEFLDDRYTQFLKDFDSLDEEIKVKNYLLLFKAVLPVHSSMNLNLTNIDEMKQMIATKYPFGGITPPDDKPKLEQEPDAPDQ